MVIAGYGLISTKLYSKSINKPQFPDIIDAPTVQLRFGIFHYVKEKSSTYGYVHCNLTNFCNGNFNKNLYQT